MLKLITFSALNEKTWKFTKSFFYQSLVTIFNWKRKPQQDKLLKCLYDSLRRFLQIKLELATQGGPDKTLHEIEQLKPKRDFVARVN